MATMPGGKKRCCISLCPLTCHIKTCLGNESTEQIVCFASYCAAGIWFRLHLPCHLVHKQAEKAVTSWVKFVFFSNSLGQCPRKGLYLLRIKVAC